MSERCAIVGGGLAGFVAYITLRHGGLESGEIAVFGTDPDPVAAWRPRAEAIRQRRMRSESDGHCYPRSFPGLAPREAVRTGSVVPLVETVCNRYRPTVAQFLKHVAELRASSGWDESFTRHRVRAVRAAPDGFEVDSQRVFRHVLVAPGHPGLSLPSELDGDERVVHAYQPHEYAPRVAVVGAGMAAATEWLNALDAGAEVVSVRRHEPVRRPLNLPRPMFTKRGLASFHATVTADRVELLRRYTEPSYPPGKEWDEPLERALREGRFLVEPSVDGEPQIICATGFQRGYRYDDLLRTLVDEHGLETEESWIVLAADATVPALTDGSRTLSLSGAPAQWAYPAADTLVGMKYVARRFLRRVESCPTR
jgi:cation diffusion facilitator CzcD-associated flavoprotein CzcO